jgi:hypothetical protein
MKAKRGDFHHEKWEKVPFSMLKGESMVNHFTIYCKENFSS